MFIIALAALFIIGFGLLYLFAPDLVWSWTRWNNELAGRGSERTDTWEVGRTFSGIALVIVGIVFGLWGCGITTQRAQEEAERTAVFHERATAQASDIAALDDAFADVIGGLLEEAAVQSQRISGGEVGLADPTAILDFGRCETSGAFYLYAIDYGPDDETYLYASGRRCQHPVMPFTTGDTLGASRLGGTWYRFRFFQDNVPFVTQQAAQIPTAIPSRTPANGQ